MKKKIVTLLQILLILGLAFAVIKYQEGNTSSNFITKDTASKDLKSLIQKVESLNKIKTTPKDLSKYLSVNMKETVAEGLNLLPLSGSDRIWLVDTNGYLLNEWRIDADKARLLPNGHLLVVHGSKFRHKDEPWKSLRPTIAEYDWYGKVVWHYTTDAPIHHDASILANNNILFLKESVLENALVQKITHPKRKEVGVEYDSILEVNKNKIVVWEWHAKDHFDLNFCGKLGCDARFDAFYSPLSNVDSSKKNIERALRKTRDWTHINTVSEIPENKWYDQGDQRFKPGNLIIMPRNFGIAYIIDKETKKKVWEYKGDYKGGLTGAHDPQMIPKGYPGAGNIIIYENGGIIKFKKESYILEINPSDNSLVWVYDVGSRFINRTRGATQRLINGNTLISEDSTGRLFEVNSEKQTVWEFKAPEPISRALRYNQDYCLVCRSNR